MLTISKCSGGQIQYYVEEVAASDYYTQGRQTTGRWIGQGAHLLGLSGEVQTTQFAALWAGYSPSTGLPLVQMQAGRPHQPAWDLTFSPPKSVSVMWSALPSKRRALIEDAHQRSIDAAMEWLQEEAITTRRGQGGRHVERVAMVTAGFRHFVNRNNEAQLHDHLVLFDLGVRADSSTGTIQSQPIYDNQRLVTKIYRAKLSSILQSEMGLKVEHQTDGSFRLAEVPLSLEEATSSRRKEILAYLAEHNEAYTPASAEMAALQTRQKKVNVPANKLFAAWHEVGRRHGFGPEQATELMNRSRQQLEQGPVQPGLPQELKRPQEQPAQAALARPESAVPQAMPTPAALDALVTQQATRLAQEFGAFQRRMLTEVLVDLAQEKGLDPQPLIKRAKDTSSPSGKLRLADPDGIWLRSRSSYQLDAIDQNAEALSELGRHALAPQWVLKASKAARLSEQQKEALLNITTRGGAIELLDGLAGTGKGAVLRAARQAWEKAGFKVIGAAPHSDAARQLEVTSGISSRTNMRLEIDLYDGLDYRLRHHAQQFLRAAMKKRTYDADIERLDKKTILVLDSAHAMSGFDAQYLLDKAQRAGTKVVMVGDRAQADPNRPCVFAYLADRYVATRLTTVERQSEQWMSHAITQALAGDVYGAYTQYALAGRLSIAPKQDQVAHDIIAKWSKDKTADLAQTLIIADRPTDVRELNARAQASRQRLGEVGKVLKQRLHHSWVYQGDRVVVGGSHRGKGYRKGDQGTVVAIGLDTITVKFDRQEKTLLGPRHVKVTFSAKEYKRLELAYALQTKRAAAVSCQRAFVLGSGPEEDSRLAYIKLSRASDRTELFAVDGANERADHLARLEREAHEINLRMHPHSARKLNLDPWAEEHRQRQSEQQRRAEEHHRQEQEQRQQQQQQTYSPRI